MWWWLWNAYQAEYSCIASKSKRVMWLYNEDACIISTNALPKKHEPIIMWTDAYRAVFLIKSSISL